VKPADKKIHSFAIVLAITALLFAQARCTTSKQKVLVFFKTAGYYHQSIPDGIAAIQKIGKENNFAVDTSKNADIFISKALDQYAAVIFLSTTDSTGVLLNDEQEKAVQQYIKKGGGFAGIHAATDAGYQWNWYGKMIGGYFESHPEIQKAKLIVVDSLHAATRGLPAEWERTDEWYNFKNLNKDVNVLITIDENSYKGGKNGAHHPVAWWHNYEGGRVFYTALGHTKESYTEPLFLQHLAGGILYAIGK
jgi:type 1 glutamine amidotransferase